MLDDSFGTEKLHLKEREVSPKKEEVVSEPIQEERVAEIPTPETKKADKSKEETISFYHGGLSSDFNIETLDLYRRSEKQNKKNRNYVGFYLYDETQRSGAETYSQQTGRSLHRFDISANARILDLENIERVTESQLNEYRSKGYDLIRGVDVRGRTEYVLLNKDIVKGVENVTNKKKR